MTDKSTTDIAEIVERTVTGLGFEFVELERLPRGLLRVTIDSDKRGGVAVDDCQAVSDQLTYLFTAEGVDYDRLEVSSPGVERALKRPADWTRFAGSPAHVELYEPLRAEGLPEAGRRKFDGVILGVEDAGGEQVIHFSIEELDIARTPSEAFRARSQRGAAKGKPEPVPVEFAPGDVDRAHLIAQLDFRGKNNDNEP
ncbi:MAG: ribosome maturation factor RimP [Duodenibacillus sp.]|nr:ribosome maturation factor RimP [Duodenibacillus sp.]